MTGSEAITQVGRILTPDFDIQEEPRRGIYRQVYEKFIRGLVPGNREKGILLIGSVGVGKSILMRVFQKLFLGSARQFRRVTAPGLAHLMEDQSPADILEQYGKTLLCDLYIDDIGLENTEFKRYGNGTNIVAEIIFDRYELFLSHGYKTHFSSNVPMSVNKDKHPNVVTLRDLYGNRLADRLTEMTETIIWKGNSLRK
jgi:DNA replication protein DnaC